MPAASFMWTARIGPTSGNYYLGGLTGGNVPNLSQINIDLVNVDDYDQNGNSTTALAYSNYPITVPGTPGSYAYSCERWIRTYWGFVAGQTTQISNCHFYRDSAITALTHSGLAIIAKLQTANNYTKPTTTNRAAGAGLAGATTTNKFFYHNGASWVGPTAANTGGSTLGTDNTDTKITFSKFDKTGESWVPSEYGQTSATTTNSCYWSDYIVLQLEVNGTVDTPGNIVNLNSGVTTAISWKMQYDEQ